MMERFVLMDGEVIWDMRRRAPGRGVYVKPQRDALEAAVKRGGFARGFKQKVSVQELDELLETMVTGIGRRLAERIQVCVRAREAWIGAEALKEGMKLGHVGVLLVASDAGQATRRKFEENARRKGIETSAHLDGARLGAITGRDFVSVLGLKGSRRASQALHDIEILRGFGAI